MYVVGHAKGKGLKVKRGDIRMPGDEIPEAETWKPHILQAHLNMKFVQTSEEFDAWKSANDKQNEMNAKRRERKNQEQQEREQNAKIAEQNAKLLENNEEGSKEGEDGTGADDKINAGDNVTTEGGQVVGTAAEGGATEGQAAGENQTGNEPPKVGEKPLEEMNKTELKEVARSMELATRGNMEELRSRITEAREKNPEQT